MAFLAVAVGVILGVILGVVACAGGSGSDRDLRDALAAEANELAKALTADANVPSPGSLRVRLAFGAAADLDLYVTDPNQETAYFANSPTRQGAKLVRDVLCGDPLPRIETIALDDPIPGRYRVGIDYPRACGDAPGAVSFVVSFDTPTRRESRRGSIQPGEFLAIVMEVDVGDAGGV